MRVRTTLDAAIDSCIAGDAASIEQIFGARLADQELCDGQLPLHLATAAGNLVAIDALIGLGASPNAADRHASGNTALHLAVLAKQHDALKLLLQLGARVDTPNGVQTAPLQDAARLGDCAAGQILLDSGANAALQNAYGNTALHRVCYFGHMAWMSWMADAVSKTTWVRLASCRNFSGLNALDVAISHDRCHMVSFLSSCGLVRSQPLDALQGLRYSERLAWLEMMAPRVSSPELTA